ncbi:hypothetical protein K402DRAFT_371074 [Aulographum hederae CBS 113979]|uniref:CWF21 domain-containing protein n=1 Tax=Aulographum hederae CBS 113979 TaxID=1176131 RepID=A0A6G1HAQ2_9PEZI|nr:hypothetical protein K402DRAFT_371074 [Aulographum hederae CBS 113979]
MSSDVGLTTPRGSGTSGYVQRNLSKLRTRDNRSAPYPDDFRKHRARQPDAAILEHERRKRLENEVFVLRDRLEEEGVDEEEIEIQCDALRSKLEKEHAENSAAGKPDVKGLKQYQTHDLAKAKIEETERLRRALGIREDYEEGSHWRRQEEKVREREERRERDEGKERERE